MNVEEAVAAVYLRATGKTTVLAESSTKYSRILGLLNFFTRAWSRERGVDWFSLYDPAFPIGSVTNTDRFDLDLDEIDRLSSREGDAVRIVWSNGIGYTDYDVVAPVKLKDYSFGVTKQSPLGFYVARIGDQLAFNHTFTSGNAEFGGTIYAPIFIKPDTLVNPGDEIQVDDPDWLVIAAAAEYVRNDITRVGQYPILAGEANERMQKMKDDQEGQIDLVDRPWVAPGGLSNESAWS